MAEAKSVKWGGTRKKGKHGRTLKLGVCLLIPGRLRSGREGVVELSIAFLIFEFSTQHSAQHSLSTTLTTVLAKMEFQSLLLNE